MDKAFLAWMHTQPCLVGQRVRELNAEVPHIRFVGDCGDWLTVHHVRFCGSPKSDRRTLALCSHHHLNMWPRSIEKLGKAKFESMYGINIEHAIIDYNSRYEMERAA